MKKGGYQIIDLKDFNIDSETSVTIKGIYNILKEVKKPLLLSGITVRNIKQQDQFVTPLGGDPNYLINISIYENSLSCQATVQQDDTLLFTVV